MIFTAREMVQLRHLEVLAGKIVKGRLSGERERFRPGPGSGFREHRSYSVGDPLRRIDWHVYARMRSLVIKEFDAEESLDIVVVQDCSASMRGPAARSAAKLAGALGAVALAQYDRVTWIPVGSARPAESFSGRGRLHALLDAVEGEGGGGTDLLGAVRAGLPRRGRGGVAFLVSDFFDPHGATRALSFLLSHRYQVRAVLMEDPDRLAPPPTGPARLVDAETRRRLRIDITPEAVAEYVRAREARVRGLKAFCRRAGAGFMRVRADQPFVGVVRAAIARGWLAP